MGLAKWQKKGRPKPCKCLFGGNTGYAPISAPSGIETHFFEMFDALPKASPKNSLTEAQERCEEACGRAAQSFRYVLKAFVFFKFETYLI